ncbi:hypothetical protein Pelo_14910 [Pelomyxa schiedti]|nr:hypothetical protein Pelo_14910 [Pelomyxa schiedti]
MGAWVSGGNRIERSAAPIGHEHGLAHEFHLTGSQFTQRRRFVVFVPNSLTEPCSACRGASPYYATPPPSSSSSSSTDEHNDNSSSNVATPTAAPVRDRHHNPDKIPYASAAEEHAHDTDPVSQTTTSTTTAATTSTQSTQEEDHTVLAPVNSGEGSEPVKPLGGRVVSSEETTKNAVGDSPKEPSVKEQADPAVVAESATSTADSAAAAQAETHAAEKHTSTATSAARDATGPFPLIFLFHGTGQDATRSSLWQQQYHRERLVRGTTDGKPVELPETDSGWQRIAERDRVLLVFGESRHTESKFISEGEHVWLPGDEDIAYVNTVLDFMFEAFPVDGTRIYACGHSNGGIFMSDLALLIDQRFAAICNHMGGVEVGNAWLEEEIRKELEDELERKFLIPTRKTPFIIVTGLYEDNRKPCHDARKAFESHGWHVAFHELEAKHNFPPGRPEFVWNLLTMYTKPELPAPGNNCILA